MAKDQAGPAMANGVVQAGDTWNVGRLGPVGLSK